ncbi:MAG: hypothetical protein ACJAYU_004260 [Bradymonadia bacterium]|jgi:hypothetical protein
MRNVKQLFAIGLGLALVGGLSTEVSAQPVEAGVNAPPSTLVLFDSSGSMEWSDNGPDHTYPTCYMGTGGIPAADGTRSRMHAAMEVLTGEVNARYCVLDARDGNPNRIDQVDPSRPQGLRHSRLCSDDGNGSPTPSIECVPASPDDAFAGLRQTENGLIDQFGERIAFGFMAFDSFPEATTDDNGMFSYGASRRMNGDLTSAFPPASPESVPTCSPGSAGCWNLGGRLPCDPSAPSNGNDCDAANSYTVAPLDPTNTLTQDEINDDVQEQLLRVTPYWSTPLGAMLEDAYTFFVEPADYYTNGSSGSAPDATRGEDDPYGECRQRYVLLITDGIPSFDVCVRTGTDGPDPTGWDIGCENYPYADAAYYAEKLFEEGIPVYVVGFNIPDDSASVLDEIAVAGGTVEARRANSGIALVFELGDIFSQIAKGTPSRTSPVNTTRISATESGRGQFTFEANFEIHEGSPYWTGDITAISRTCGGGSLGSPEEESVADWLDGQTVGDLASRSILTTAPGIHSCAFATAGDPRDSLFAPDFGSDPLRADYGVTESEIADACQVGARPGTSGDAADACWDLTDGDVGVASFLPEDRLGSCMTSMDINTFAAGQGIEILGAETQRQAEMFHRWLRGWTLTEIRRVGGYTDEIDTYLPTAEFRWDDSANEYTNDRVSRFPAIVHSSPGITTVPDSRLEISEAYKQFVEATEDRPSVLYTATADGLLRAIDADTHEEIFTFLPSSISHRVGETMRAHRETIDGAPIVTDVRLYRDADGVERWGTVLILPYRGAARGVVALDVTDPTQPRFLWELDSELDPQLGLTYGAPAVGTVFLAQCPDDQTIACERAVAVFGGGAPPSGLTGWADSNIGRTIYVVDVETGRVLRRFTHTNDENGDSVPIPGPVVGDASLFDTFLGSLATRAFIGTINGYVLRVDLAGTNPALWSVDTFFDPGVELGRADVGGVFFRPTIALEAATGRAAVVFGTGNLDDLDRLVGERNYVVSVSEQPVFDGSGALERIRGEVNWALELETNERMTARARVFNRRAYFATFKAADDLCDIGGARLYALDYLGADDNRGSARGLMDLDQFFSYLHSDPAGDPEDPGNPQVAYWDASTFSASSNPTIPEKAIIYAVEITERISCFLEETFEDDAGGDGVTSRSVSDQGEFVLQLGVSHFAESATAGGSPSAESTLAEIELEQPGARVIPTSWSVIFE